MLRISSPPRPARAVSTAIACAAAIGAFITASAAESLAQPADNSLHRAAADYIRFREDVAALEATPFDDAETTREAHRRLSAHDSAALSSGWVAYAALVAADSPAFRAALEAELDKKMKRGGEKLEGKDAFFARLAEDPGYPRTLDGANEAIARVLAMTTSDAARFVALGEVFKEQAYALQRTSWGKAAIPAPSARLSEADAFARSRPSAVPPTFASVTEEGVTSPRLEAGDAAWKAGWGAEAGAGRMSEPNAQVIMNRVLNLAARYAVGGVNEKSVAVYAQNNRSDQCLSLAELTLRQCIAATRAPYEEAFCLGEHGLKDVATCIGWVAGVE